MSLPCLRVCNSHDFKICFNALLHVLLTMHILMQLLQNQTVIAIQAPRASFVEVPDPDEVGILMILVRKFACMLSWFLIGIIPTGYWFLSEAVQTYCKKHHWTNWCVSPEVLIERL